MIGSGSLVLRRSECQRADLGYDPLAERICFHGGCILPPACIRRETCVGAQSFVYSQMVAWDKHRKCSATDAPYAFWLGAEG